MNTVERNIVFNELSRIRLEWTNADCDFVKKGDDNWNLLNDAREIILTQLGSDVVTLWDGQTIPYCTDADGYCLEVGAVTDFIRKCNEGKDRSVTAFDSIAENMLVRLENYLDGLGADRNTEPGPEEGTDDGDKD